MALASCGGVQSIRRRDPAPNDKRSSKGESSGMGRGGGGTLRPPRACGSRRRG